ncbi:MAG TPA: hypothetical protein VFV86_10665 [Nitrososphaeraceae archaeon]|nr:hypothetical protein [Nitrososphaeraceae archaeon]
MYLKIVSDLFLGSQELNRFIQSLDEKGFRRLLLLNTLGFGVVDNSKDGQFDNFKVEQGTNIGTIKHAEGFAIDTNGQIIYKAATDNIALANDNQWYWVKIKHAYSTLEIGTVSIDRQGNLVGNGTEFTKILRGVPNNPIRIKFNGAVLNTSEYDVFEVIDDTHATLTGDFVSESNLTLVVVGAYTPDVVIASENKNPFQYDGCEMILVLETVSNTVPTLLQDEEFVIARVRRNGATITIQDKRGLAISKVKADYDLTTLSSNDNPCIGVEAVKFNHNNTPRDKNLVYIGWGMRSSNWTINTSINTVTILGGLGGKFKTTADFTDGDFDGWRLYTKNGKYKIIRQSSIAALQINLVVDSLDPDDFVDTTQELHIVPNCDEVEIIVETGDESELPEVRISSPVNQGYVKIPLIVYDNPTCQYVVKYRYKNFKTFSQETLIPNDLASGYLIESAFDIDGDQDNNTRQTYQDGIITLTLASNAYSSRLDQIETGDLGGVEYLAIDTDIDPIVDFVVGQRKQHVIITNDDDLDASDSDFGSTYLLTDDVFINLRSDLPTSGLTEGNEFLIQIRGDYNFNGFGIRIVQDYISGANPGIDLYGLTEFDLDQARQDNLFFRCKWDGTRWFVQYMVHIKDKYINASDNISQPRLKYKVLEIGDWNMDTDASKSVSHGVNQKSIRSIDVIVRNDLGAPIPLIKGGQASSLFDRISGWVNQITATNIIMFRGDGQEFDSAAYDSTGFNRGWIVILYED